MLKIKILYLLKKLNNLLKNLWKLFIIVKKSNKMIWICKMIKVIKIIKKFEYLF